MRYVPVHPYVASHAHSQMFEQLQELMANPGNIAEAMQNPSIARLMQRFAGRAGGGGFPGMGGGFGGGGATEASGAPEPVQIRTQQELDLILEESNKTAIPVIIDYYAKWCGPCKMIAPQVAALAQEYKQRAVIIRVDVDDCEPGVRGSVRSMPTFKSFLGQDELDSFSGADPTRLRALVDDAVTRAEEIKATRTAKKYKHFPLRMNELVLYKDYAAGAASKVLAKVKEITSTWDVVTNGIAPWIVAGFKSNEEFYEAVNSLMNIIQGTGAAKIVSSDSDDSKESESKSDTLSDTQRRALAVLLLDLKGANATPGIHIARWLALTGAGCNALMQPLRDGSPVTGVGALCAIIERRDHLMSSHLAARSLCNFFARMRPMQFIMKQAETVIPPVTALLFKEPTTEHVVAHCFAVLINFAIGVNAGYCGSAQLAYETRVMLLMQLIDAVTPTLLQSGRGALYRALAVIGTLLLDEPGLVEIAQSVDFSPEAWLATAGANPDDATREAVAELRQILDSHTASGAKTTK